MSCVWWWCFIFIASFVGGNKIKEPRYPEPKFLPRLLNVTVREGAKAKLPCAVHFVGTRQVTWRKIGSHHFLTVGKFKWAKDNNLELEMVKLTPNVTEWNLIILRVNKNNSGVYQCKISASTTMTRNISLTVKGPPVIRKVPPVMSMSGKHYVERGQPIHLFCNTTGPVDGPKRKLDHTQLRVDWFKDGNSLQHSKDRHAVVTNYYLVQSRKLVSELYIDRSRSSDTGTYICRSPTDNISSHKVTVLFADTTNVKRDNADIESSVTPSSSAVSVILSSCPIITIVIVMILNDVGMTSSNFSTYDVIISPCLRTAQKTMQIVLFPSIVQNYFSLYVVFLSFFKKVLLLLLFFNNILFYSLILMMLFLNLLVMCAPFVSVTKMACMGVIKMIYTVH